MSEECAGDEPSPELESYNQALAPLQPIAKTAQELGVKESALYRWASQHNFRSYFLNSGKMKAKY